MAGVGKAGDHLPNVIRTPPPALQTFPTGGEERRRRGGGGGREGGIRGRQGPLIGRPTTHARFQCWAKRKSGNINWCSAQQQVIAVEWRRRMDLFSREGEILDSPWGQSSIPFPDSALLAMPLHCVALTCSLRTWASSKVHKSHLFSLKWTVARWKRIQAATKRWRKERKLTPNGSIWPRTGQLRWGCWMLQTASLQLWWMHIFISQANAGLGHWYLFAIAAYPSKRPRFVHLFLISSHLLGCDHGQQTYGKRYSQTYIFEMRTSLRASLLSREKPTYYALS